MKYATRLAAFLLYALVCPLPVFADHIELHGDDGSVRVYLPAATQPVTQPTLPGPTPAPVPDPTPGPPTLTLIPRGGAGLLAAGIGRPLRVGEVWLRADGRDPTVPGGQGDPKGPDGVTIRGGTSAAVENATVERFGQNVVIQSIAGPATARNLRSFDSWSLNSAAQYQGQGLFADGVAGGLTVDGCIFDQNGWRPGLPLRQRDSFGHSNYFQRGQGPATITDTAAMRPSNAGFMLRSSGTVAGCFVADAGTGLIIMGRGDTADVSDTVILGGHRYYDGTNYTGNCGAMLYAHLTRFKNVYWVGVPGQDRATAAEIADGKKSYNTACIALSSTYTKEHPDWPDPHPAATFENCHIFGWPGPALTLDNKPIPIPPGLTVHPSPVAIDVAGLVARVRSGKTTTAAAIREVKAAAGVQ